MSKNLVSITIRGQNYSIRTDSDPFEVKQIAAMVDQRMKEIEESTRTVDSLRSAILTAMTLADDLWQMKKRLDQNENEQLNREQNLVDMIDQVLIDQENGRDGQS